ncbi:MAG: ABC transporter substrate-binding protein [Anaerolineae bacterium]
MSGQVTRRSFLYWAGLATGASVIAACTPQLAPTTEATKAPQSLPTPNLEATAAVESMQATEDAIAAAARADEEAKKILEMTPEELKALEEKSLSEAQSAGKTVIEMLSAFGTVLEDKTQPHFWIIRDFMAKNPNIYVKYSPSSAYTGAFNEVIMMRIASGDPPDCIYHYSSPIAYAARGTCLPVDDLMDADPVANKQAFFESAIRQVQWNGKTWGIPLNGSPDAMWYNTELLQAAGLPTERDKMPKTLDELRAMSAKLTKWNGEDLEMAGASPWTQSWAWPGKFVANGGVIWDGEKYSIDHEKNVELVEYWLKWIDEEYMGKVDVISLGQGYSGTYPENKFGLKLQAISDEGIWAYTHCPPEVKYEVAKMPIGPSGTASATSNWPNLMFIPSNAKHPQEGWKLCAYFATEGQYEWWDRWADVPVWKAFPEDRAPKDLISRVGEEKAIDLTKFARSCLPDVVVQWNSPIDDFATDELSRAIDQALHKNITAKESLTKAQEVVAAKLDEVLSGS